MASEKSLFVMEGNVVTFSRVRCVHLRGTTTLPATELIPLPEEIEFSLFVLLRIIIMADFHKKQ